MEYTEALEVLSAYRRYNALGMFCKYCYAGTGAHGLHEVGCAVVLAADVVKEKE